MYGDAAALIEEAAAAAAAVAAKRVGPVAAPAVSKAIDSVRSGSIDRAKISIDRSS